MSGGSVVYDPKACASNDADLTLFELPVGFNRYMDVTSQSVAEMSGPKGTQRLDMPCRVGKRSNLTLVDVLSTLSIPPRGLYAMSKIEIDLAYKAKAP